MNISLYTDNPITAIRPYVLAYDKGAITPFIESVEAIAARCASSVYLDRESSVVLYNRRAKTWHIPQSDGSTKLY